MGLTFTRIPLMPTMSGRLLANRPLYFCFDSAASVGTLMPRLTTSNPLFERTSLHQFFPMS